MALYHFHAKMLSRGTRNCVRALAYRSGCKLVDLQTKETFDYTHKDVQYVELLLPKGAPSWAKDIQETISKNRERGVQGFSDLAESSEKRIDGQVYREFEFALQRELTDDQNIELARAFLQDQVAGRRIGVLANFHMDVDEETGERKPHCHAILLTRQFEEEGLSRLKDRSWEKRDLIKDLREQYASYTNFYLKLHGHETQIDHRSYKDQGVDLEAQPKYGKRARGYDKIEEGRGGVEVRSFGSGTASDKGVRFRDVQLRNLYRIVREPELVFEIVTRNHTTFTWGDIQKKLHQYVDNPQLFERLDLRLRNSTELLMLRPETNESPAIYTTHSQMEGEKELVKLAEGFATQESHGVLESAVKQGILRTKESMTSQGYSLSSDQEEAIRHLVSPGQLKSVIGYAGAGKTTALETCREIWEESGYEVCGLAPTGRAANNLEESGIRSRTLHKFLKSYAEGRCQYNPRSVLVLDEGGMVDGGRLKDLLRAVDKLGVKLVVVGDGAQLQPVEAGPAFRLITERVGASYLKEVVRQKESWQREATVYFGKQETREALAIYQDHGNVRLIEEKIPEGEDPIDVLNRYEVARRTSGLIYREILRDLKSETPAYDAVKDHPDYAQFRDLRDMQRNSTREILERPKTYKPLLQERQLDPTDMARLFIGGEKGKDQQYQKAHSLLKERRLESLIGLTKTPGLGVETRAQAKQSLIEAWTKAYNHTPHQTLAILAYSNRDVRDLNGKVRNYLKAEKKIGIKEHTYTIKREEEDDFGRRKHISEKRAFSTGDRLVFTRNRRDLGVTNGTMGTIVSLEKNKIDVKLDEGKSVSFAPTLNPYFDQGWAITVHKSQGTTVDKSFVLLSHEMNQNLTYVAMTRHREGVQAYGSTLDFWREEKVQDILSKSGDKLSAGDYLDVRSLETLMKEEDKFLEKLLNHLSDEVHAMKTVTKEAVIRLADHFLGRDQNQKDRATWIPQEILREEQRAETLLRRDKEPTLDSVEISVPKRIIELRNEFIEAKKDEGGRLPSSYALLAYMKAERLYTIEQRITKEHKKAHGEKPDPIILPYLAQSEFSHNDEERENLMGKLQKEHSLTKKAAAVCALEIIRHKEKQGDYPSDKQKFHLIDISKQLVILEKELKKQGFNANQAVFLQKDVSEKIQASLRGKGSLKEQSTKNLGIDAPTFKSLHESSIATMKTLESTLHRQQQTHQKQLERERNREKDMGIKL